MNRIDRSVLSLQSNRSLRTAFCRSGGARRLRQGCAALAAMVAVAPTLAADFGGWTYRRQVTLSAATATSDYQTRVELTSGSFDYSHCHAAGDDLRFATTNDVALSYWIESWEPLGRSVLWVKVPDSGTTAVRLYYGKPSASAASSGSDTFIFFDDFNRADLADLPASEPARYVEVNNGTWAIESQKLKNVGPCTDPSKLYVAALGTVTYPVVVRAKLQNATYTGDRIGLSSCFGSDGKGYCTLLCPSVGKCKTLNDFVQWGTEWDQGWQSGSWYWMEHAVPNPAAKTMQGRVWAPADAPGGWTVTTFNDGRSWGYVGFAGHLDAGNTSFFDDFAVRKYAAVEPTATLTAEETIMPGLAQVVTDAPSAISTTGATLNGGLLSTGTTATAVWVFWGATDQGLTNQGWDASFTWTAPQATGTFAHAASLTTDQVCWYRFAASNAVGWAYDQARALITAPVTVSRKAHATEIGLEAGAFTVHRAETATNVSTVVNYAISGGSAVSDTDYLAPSGSVTIPVGATEASFAITPKFDRFNEGTEDVEVTVQSGSYPVGAPATATLEIADNAAVAQGGLSLIWDNASGNGAWDASSLNWHKPNEANGTVFFLDGDSVSFGDTGVGAVTVTAGGVQPSAIAVGHVSGTYSLAGGAIGGGGALTKSGAGTLTLSTDNTGLTGGIAISGSGITRFNAAVALGPVGGVTVAAGSSADINFAGFGGSLTSGDLACINPASQGTLVFNQAPATSAALDLTGFSPRLRLGGSFFDVNGGARFNGAITPAANGYAFGGGGGMLAIATALADGAAACDVSLDASSLARPNCNSSVIALREANSYRGVTRVANGYLRIAGANGSARNSPELVVQNSGILGLDPGMKVFGWGDNGSVPLGNNNDRLGDTATVRLRGGTLLFFGHGNTGTSETAGDLSVEAGHSLLDIRYADYRPYVSQTAAEYFWVSLNGAGLLDEIGGTQAAELRFAQLVRGADHGHLLLRGQNLGVAGATDATRVVFASPPTMIGGSGGAGTTTISLVPFACNDANGPLFVTHDANGLRALNPATEFAPFAVGMNTTDNASLSESATVSSATTVNALLINAYVKNLTLGGSSALTLSSGCLSVWTRSPEDGGDGWNISVPLDFAGQEGHVYFATRAYHNQYFNSPMSNTDGNGVSFSISGGWYLRLGGASTYTGPTTFNRGGVYTTGDDKLPNASDVRVRAGASLGIGDSTATETIASLAGAGSVWFGSGNSRLILGGGSGAAGEVTVNGAAAFLAPGDDGVGTLILGGNISALNVQSGELRVTLDGPDRLGVLAIGSAVVTLGADAKLAVQLGFLPDVGDAFRVLTVGGSTAITGTFAGMGPVSAVYGTRKVIFDTLYNSSLAGGDGNDLVLQVAAVQPASAGTVMVLR